MKKISFEERANVRKYLFHNVKLVPIDVSEVNVYGEVLTKDGEYLSAPAYCTEKFFAEELEEVWYKIENDAPFDENDDGPWMDNPKYYERGMVVTLDSGKEIADYIFDGWCNLYPRPEASPKITTKDCHRSVCKIFG